MGDNLVMTSNNIIARLIKEATGLSPSALTSKELVEIAQHIAYLDQSNDNLVESVKYLNGELEKEQSKMIHPINCWSMKPDGTLICNQCGKHFYQEDATQVWVYCPICGSKNII